MTNESVADNRVTFGVLSKNCRRTKHFTHIGKRRLVTFDARISNAIVQSDSQSEPKDELKMRQPQMRSLPQGILRISWWLSVKNWSFPLNPHHKPGVNAASSARNQYFAQLASRARLASC